MLRKIVMIMLFLLPAYAQTIIQTSAQLGMKCDGATDDTQRFLNALGIGGGTNNVYLIFNNGTCNLKSINPITVPSTITLDFTQQGALSLASGSTMNVNAAIIDLDNHAVFNGLGTYNITPRNPVSCAAISGGIACNSSAVSVIGPVLRATDAPFSCVGDNSTVNDTCWATLQTSASAGDFTIYFPKGTYKWATSPSFTTPVTIQCEKGTFFNYTGTGNEITFGDIGTVNGLNTFDFHPYRVLGCGHIGGASATQGIFVGYNHWKVEIADNLWYNWGSTTNFAIYCHGNDECLVHHNKYWQDTGAATNWLYAPDAGTPGFGALSVDHNDLNCILSPSNPNQGACGIAIWASTTTGTQIVDNPFISAFAVGIRIDPASSGISVMVARNYIEENSTSVGIQLGNPASSNQVIDSILVDGNRFSLGGSLVAIGMANVSAKVTNSRFIDNFVRPGANIALVAINNLTGQTGNCGSGNIDFAAGTKTAAADAGEVWTDCNKTIGTNVVRISNSTSGGSASGFLAHTTTAGGAYGWQSDDGAADSKTWDFIQATGTSNICFRAVNDANTVANNVFCATRGTGAAVANLSIATPILSTGTGPTLTGTGACATITTQVGGSFAGSAKCTGTTGASTLTITFSATAANGYICSVYDETTPANLFQQTSHTTTTCVLTAAAVTQNNVFVFKGTGF